MNKTRQKRLVKMMSKITNSYQEFLKDCAALEEFTEEIKESYDNLSDRAKENDNGQNMSMDITALEEAVDQINSIDLKKTLEDLAEEIDLDSPEIPQPKLTKTQFEERRESRIPQWMKDRLKAAEEKSRNAEKKASSLLGEPTGNPHEFTTWEHDPSNPDKLLVKGYIEAKSTGIRMKIITRKDLAGKEDHYLEIHSKGNLNILPMSSNMIHLEGKEWKI